MEKMIDRIKGTLTLGGVSKRTPQYYSYITYKQSLFYPNYCDRILNTGFTSCPTKHAKGCKSFSHSKKDKK